MPPPPPHKPPQRTPLSIDDVAIDFSAVKPPVIAAYAQGVTSTATVAGSTAPQAGANPALMPSLLELMQQQEGDSGRLKVSDVRAFDPSLEGLTQRRLHNIAAAAGNRRKKVFGGQPFMPPIASASTQPMYVKGSKVESNVAAPAVIAGCKNNSNSSDSNNDGSSAAQDALDFLINAQQKQQQQRSSSDLQRRRDTYMRQLRSFCQRDRALNERAENESNYKSSASPRSATAITTAFPSTTTSHTNSLLTQLFQDGVPDIEPWDRWTSAMPRYGEAKHLILNPLSATARQIQDAGLNLIHHPVIPDTHYTRHYQYRDLEQPILPKEFKTREELRAERRERLREKQAKKQQERAAAASAVSNLQESTASHGSLLTSAASQLLHDRLSTKNLALNLFASSVLNPLATDTKVLQQYELRYLEHQRRNHDRHVAALPNQILKRERDQQRFAVEYPIMRAYRIFPIYSPAHLGKLRHYANDNLLRGFVLYVADCDALVVLSGGEKAMRHLDHWILIKMAWEHPDTRAVRLATIPLMDATCFSFHLPKAQQQQQGGGGRLYKQGKLVEGASVAHATTADSAATAAEQSSSGKEPVFINMVPSVEEGEKFLRQLPAPSSPWGDLSAIWRTAFLQDGLQEH